MLNKVKCLAAAAAMVVAGSAASAAITLGDQGASGGIIIDFTQNPSPNFKELTFVSGQTPFFAYQDFTVGSDFSLLLQDYQPTQSGDASSFFSLLNLDTNTAITTAAGVCSSSGVLAIIDGIGCNAVNGAGGTAGNPPPILFSGLSSGEYRLAVYETGDPTTAQFDFEIAAVPVPAAGFLLAGAIGALGVARRRKKA